MRAGIAKRNKSQGYLLSVATLSVCSSGYAAYANRSQLGARLLCLDQVATAFTNLCVALGLGESSRISLHTRKRPNRCEN